MMLGKLTFLDRETEPSTSDSYALGGAGLVAGLTAAFCTSVWFSAVEGEVYAMSSMFTCMTIWAKYIARFTKKKVPPFYSKK